MLIATQFLGALNENGLKQLIVFLVLATGLKQVERDQLVLVVGALFAVPYILFSMAGGFLADRYSKRTVTIATKMCEVGVMLLAIASLAARSLTLEFAAGYKAKAVQSSVIVNAEYGTKIACDAIEKIALR